MGRTVLRAYLVGAAFLAAMPAASPAADVSGSSVAIETGGRSIVVHLRDPNVEMTVFKSGRLLKFADRKSGKEALIEPGGLTVLLSEGVTGIQLLGGELTIARCGPQAVEVRRTPQAKAIIPSPSRGPVSALQGHRDRVFSVAFFPDGHRAVSAGGDGTVRLWDLEAGEELRRLEEEVGQAYIAVPSPDGARLASGGVHGTVHLRDLASGQEIRRWRLGGFVRALAFTPKGDRLLAAGTQGPVRVFDVATGAEVRRFDTPMDVVEHAVISRDGRLALASGGYLNNSDTRLGPLVRVWDLATGRTVFDLKVPVRTALRSAAISPDGRWVLAEDPADRRQPALWDVTTGEKVRRLLVPVPADSVAFTPDGRHAVLASITGVAQLIDCATGMPIRGFGSPAAPTSIAVSRDGTRVLIGGAKGDIRLISLPVFPDPAERSPGEAQRFLHDHYVYCAVFSHDGRRVLSGGFDLTLRLWDAVSGRELRKFQGNKAYHMINSIAWSSDGRYAVLGTGQYRGTGRVILWDVEQWKEVRHFGDPSDPIARVAISPDGRLTLSGDLDGVLTCWEVETGRQVSRFEAPVRGVRHVAFAPDGRHAVYAGGMSDAGRLATWNVHTGREVREFKKAVAPLSAVFVEAGSRLLVACRDGALRTLDVDGGDEIRQTRITPGAQCVALSADGQWAVSGEHGGTVRVWSVERGDEVARFDGHTEQVVSVAIAPDGRHALSGSYDRTVRLWTIPGK